MARPGRRGGSLLWPGLAVGLVLVLSMSGALGSLRHALPLLLSAGDAPYASVTAPAETDPERLRARLLVMLGEASPDLVPSIDGCFLIRTRRATEACAGDAERLLLEQVDLRDLVVDANHIGAVAVTSPGPEDTAAILGLSVPWRPRVQARLSDVARSLAEIGREGEQPLVADLPGLSERLQDGGFGDLLGRNHRILGACNAPPRVAVIEEPFVLPVRAGEAEDVIALLMGLEQNLCRTRSWLF